MTGLRKTIKLYKRRFLHLMPGRRGTAASVVANERTGEIELALTSELCHDWQGTKRGSRITFIRKPLLRGKAGVFTMGSCFAVEIRHALMARGYDVYPKYNKIEFDGHNQLLASLPARDNVNHYNSFVIRQEFERAFGNSNYDPNDFIEHVSPRQKSAMGEVLRWQDPYRKRVYAVNRESLFNLSSKISGCIRTAIHNADIYVITLGLTEVWKNNTNGLFINQAPSEKPGFSFVESTYEQNYDNMHRVCSLLEDHFPGKPVILTVSPVPLNRTFTSNDIVVANMESKSILRAVAARVAKEKKNVTYWPSYEIALARDLFEDDGRHVRRAGIDLIVDQFIKVHTA